ncbi:MAG: purine-nucleoside phosphorylase [Synergistaceae bacterium]|jgi:purine-nucleoside phosphorylase|nr:purine-nucleoside phosphorylase [Synergistaceae bacterium]
MTVFTHAQDLIKTIREVTEEGIGMLNAEKTAETLAAISRRATLRPRVGIILGSGLGGVAEAVENSVAIPYEEIPYWPRTTAIGHAGRLLIGTLEGVPVVVMQGRVHFYEGYTMEEITFPIRIFGEMGVESLIATNAAGGINLAYSPGDLAIINDHINLMGTNPLIGSNNNKWGPRFPDMTYAYDQDYVQTLLRVGEEEGVRLRQGVYIAFSGPSYETPAEIRMSRALGADLVGMSTVPEVIVANHMGIKVAAISCVSNYAAGVKAQKLHHQEVLDAMAGASESMTALIRGFLRKIAPDAGRY